MSKNNHEETYRLYRLATSQEFQEIKEEFLKHIIRMSTSNVSSERIQGMLNLLAITQNWILNYENELEERKRKM